MTDIKLRIEVNPNAETETLGNITNKVNDIGSNANLSNASFKANSNGVYINTSNPKESGREMLSWGENGILKFDSAGNLSSNGTDTGYLASETEPDEFVWGVVPSTKKYSVKLTFSNATSLKDIVIYGDSTAKQFPTKAIIDGSRTIYSDDPKWAINMETESDTHTIEFTEWNRANYNACLTKIRVMLQYYEIDKFNGLQSVESLSQSTSDPKSIAYGVLASSGNANIVDISGEIADMIQDGIIPNSNVPAELYVNGNKIQEHIITDSDYDIDNIFSIQMSNDLSRLNLYYKGYKKVNIQCSLYDLIVDVFQSLDNAKYTINYIDSILLGQDLKAYTQSIIYPTPFISYLTYNNVIKNICEIGQFQFIINQYGNPQFINARPIYSGEKFIKIPTYIQSSKTQKDVIIKNKVELVKYNPSYLLKEINKTVATQTIIPSTSISTPISLVDYYYKRGTSLGAIFTQAARVEGIVASGSFEIDKNPTIQKVNKDVQYSVSGRKWSNVSFPPTLYSSAYDPQSKWESQTNSLMRSGVSPIGSPTSFETPLSNASFDYTPIASGDKDNVNISFSNSVELQETSDKYIITYNILVKTNTFYIQSSGQELNSSQGEIQIIDVINFSINGDSVSIAFKDETINVGNAISKNILTLENNEMLQENVSFNGMLIGNVIGQNIINTYKNGIFTCNTTIQCNNMYFNDGTLAKNWANGEILQVGDFVRIDKDNNGTSLYKYQDGSDIIWRITGRKFKYDGVPLIDLELQELIDI